MLAPSDPESGVESRTGSGRRAPPRSLPPASGSPRRADLPDHAGPWDLHKRAVIGTDIMRVGTEIPDCAVIGDIGASVRAEADIGRAVEAGRVIGANEGLIAGEIAGEVLEAQGERPVQVLIEVDQLDLVPDLGSSVRR